MGNRLTSHLFWLLAIVGIEVAGYYGIHRAALIRGYETSWIGGVRDLLERPASSAVTAFLGRRAKSENHG